MNIISTQIGDITSKWNHASELPLVVVIFYDFTFTFSDGFEKNILEKNGYSNPIIFHPLLFSGNF